MRLNWQNARAWNVLDTQFGHGRAFFRLWSTWRQDEQAPRLLHVVAFTPYAPSWPDVEGLARKQPDVADELQKLQAHWQGLDAGFHRFLLDGGRLTLTLCVGEQLKLLREQQFLADCVVLNGADSDQQPAWDLWHSKALARLCKPGTTLDSKNLSPLQRECLIQCGFTFGTEDSLGVFAPSWKVKQTRRPWAIGSGPARSCAVIGAGLAGASVAAALARRGWAVQVLDAADSPAAGASGLPVGLMVPHISGDDSPRSRLSRRGIHLTRQYAQDLLIPGMDWLATGVMEQTPNTDVHPTWHASAAWIKPAALVRAWLALPGIRFTGRARVAFVTSETPLASSPDQAPPASWCLLDERGKVLAQADHVVFAAAQGTSTFHSQIHAKETDLVGTLTPALQGLHGQVSWARQRPELNHLLPQHPVNGLGSLVAHIPWENGLAWFVGATYAPQASSPANVTAQHQANLGRLKQLAPVCATHLERDFNGEGIQAWSETRCTTVDRLPAVGPWTGGDHPSLWMSVGMGSRGLSFAALCAELLAARMNSEPLPLEASLARSLDSLRFGRKAAASPHQPPVAFCADLP